MLSEESLTRQPEEVFDIICKLGEGSYGSVYKAIHKDSEQVVAIKQVPLDTDLQEIIKEISIMQQCDSPYVVRYYGSYFKNTDLWIIMEYCGAGSVSDIIRLRQKALTECQIATILSDALKGLEYLHLRRKIHRDIKAGNILLNCDGHAKLADFGVAGQINETIAKRNTVIGSPFWMAPEIILEIGYDCVADIWSLGITALEMAEGKPPYADIHPMRAVFMIPSKPPPSFREPDRWSPEFIDFVSMCLVKNPNARASATTLIKHVFLSNAKGPSVLNDMITEACEIRNKKNQSMSKAKFLIPDKVVVEQEAGSIELQSSELATMVINSDSDDNGRTLCGPTTNYRPQFLDQFDKTTNLEPVQAESVTNDIETPSTSTDNEPLEVKLQRIKPENCNFDFLKSLSYDELQERYNLLDLAMEKEIEELQTHFLLKRKPIEQAIQNKHEKNRNF